MDIPGDRFTGKRGLIRLRNGIGRFPDGGIWTSDDRILAFFSQSSGGLTRLIYHGRQPQSANAFLLQESAGAIKLSMEIGESAGSEVIFHRFQQVQAWPYGWTNEFQQAGLKFRSGLCTQGESISWQVQCLNLRSEPVVLASRLNFDRASLAVRVNGSRSWRDLQSSPDKLCLAAHDQLQTSTWINVPGFKDQFIDAETFLLIAGNHPQARREGLSITLPAEKILPGQWGRPHLFFIACASSELQAEQTLARLQAAPESAWKEQTALYSARAAALPHLRLGGYPFAAATFRLAPLYTEAVKVRNSGALRSSAGGYYFVWGWDSLMGGHELARSGDPGAARQLLDFISTHLAEDGSVPHRYDNDFQPLQVTGFDFISQLYVSLLYQYYSETLDRETLTRCYPAARKIFNELAARADQRGFYPTLGMYPDAPLKLGRSPQSSVAYEIGFWYTICRMMEGLAQLQGEIILSQTAADLAGRLQGAYLAEFYDPQKGFLVDSVDGVSGKSNGTFPKYSLFPLHNPFGAWLLRPVMRNLSDFIQRELFKADGIRMVPEWDAHAGTETVTGDCWFLHFDLYCLKAFRRAGDQGGIERWLRLADGYFKQRGVIPELQMLAAGKQARAGWKGITGQIWQLFAMSGWLKGLLEGVAGLETDLGGLTYIPCGLSSPVALRNYPFRGGRWNVSVSGTGGWVNRFVLDGEPIRGTLKIPGEAYSSGNHVLVVERGSQQPGEPLLLEAVGGSVLSPGCSQGRLSVKIQAHNQVNLVFFCPTSPRVPGWMGSRLIRSGIPAAGLGRSISRFTARMTWKLKGQADNSL